jgi:hypothetical protein
MRYVLLAALVVVFGLATSAGAQPADLIGVSGYTVTNGQLSGAGTVGGVSGTITSTVANGDCTASCSGNWTMMVGSANFAGGTYTCDQGQCLYMGSIMAPDATGFAISTTTLSIGTDMDGAIYRHGLWVNDVTSWANIHPDVLAGLNMTQAQFISNAAADTGVSQ